MPVVFVGTREQAPQAGKRRHGHVGAADRLPAVVAVIVHVEENVKPPVVGVTDNVVETLEFGGVERTVQLRLHALPQERHADDVHAARGEVIDGRAGGIEIIAAGDAGNLAAGEFRAGDIDAGEELRRARR